MDPEPRHFNVLSDRIGGKIDLVPELGQRLDPEILAKRCPSRLEERLGGDHQDFHTQKSDTNLAHHYSKITAILEFCHASRTRYFCSYSSGVLIFRNDWPSGSKCRTSASWMYLT